MQTRGWSWGCAHSGNILDVWWREVPELLEMCRELLARHGHCSQELTEVTCTRLGSLACLGEGLTGLRLSSAVYRQLMDARVEGVIFFSGEDTGLVK